MSDIQISGLTKRFGSAAVLQELDLTVRDGEFLTLLGASGCGKSTLLKLIAGLDTPDTGTIRMGDRDLLALSPSARDCAMVFQSYALYPHMTVRENISMPLVCVASDSGVACRGHAWCPPGCGNGSPTSMPARRRSHDDSPSTDCSIASRRISQAASANALPWRVRWFATLPFSCSTSPSRTWTPTFGMRCAPKSASFTTSWA